MKLSTTPEGHHLVVADGDSERRALRRFAADASRLAHPGVAEVVELVDTAHAVSLVSTSPGDATLSSAHPRSATSLARLMAALSTTVADLHDTGVSHGHITKLTVAVDPAQRPVLLLGPPRLLDTEPAHDVVALGELLNELLAELPAPQRETVEGRLLTALADDARSVSIEARRLAELTYRLGSGQHKRSRGPLGIAALAAAFVAFAVAIGLQLANDAHDSADAVAPPEPIPTSSVLEHDGRRWVAESPTDIVTSHDWQCTGTDLPVALRPDSGELFVWTDWEANAVPAIARIPGGVGFDTAAAPCGSIAVLTASETIVVPVVGLQDRGDSS